MSLQDNLVAISLFTITNLRHPTGLEKFEYHINVTTSVERATKWKQIVQALYTFYCFSLVMLDITKCEKTREQKDKLCSSIIRHLLIC